MAASRDWNIPAAAQPKRADYGYDLDAALSAVVGIRALVPADAFTADILGTERLGNGVLIGERGLVLTIGYLITEAETIWLTLADGGVAPGHALAYDQETGFGLVQPLARVDFPSLPLGDSGAAESGDRVVLAAAGGRGRSVAAQIVAKQEFAGYWEYLLEEAIFTAPAHPFWGGTALIGPTGDLLGIGSLQLEGETSKGAQPLNMVVPIDLLKPILADLRTLGRPNRPARPWLGLYATDMDNKLVLVGVAKGGPADRADLRPGDVVLAVAGTRVHDLAGLFRRLWSLGSAGIEVPLTIWRDGETVTVRVRSGDRSDFLRKPRVH